MAARMLTAFNARSASSPVVFSMENIPANLSLTKVLLILQLRGKNLLGTNQTIKGVAGVNIMVQVQYLMARLVPLHLKALNMVDQMELLTIAALPTSNSAILRIILKSVTSLVILLHLLQIILFLRLLHGQAGVTFSRPLYCAPLPPTTTKSSLRLWH